MYNDVRWLLGLSAFRHASELLSCRSEPKERVWPIINPKQSTLYLDTQIFYMQEQHVCQGSLQATRILKKDVRADESMSWDVALV